MKAYGIKGNLQLASLKHISTHLLSQSEQDDLKETFFALNRSNTGEMTRDELIQAYWENGYKDMNYYEIDKILAKVDLKNSGTINFGDYLMPSVDPIDIITKDMKCNIMIKQM